MILLESNTDIPPAITDFTPKKPVLGAFASSNMDVYDLFQIFKKSDTMLYNDIACDAGMALPTFYYPNFSPYGCGYTFKETNLMTGLYEGLF